MHDEYEHLRESADASAPGARPICGHPKVDRSRGIPAVRYCQRPAKVRVTTPASGLKPETIQTLCGTHANLFADRIGATFELIP